MSFEGDRPLTSFSSSNGIFESFLFCSFYLRLLLQLTFSFSSLLPSQWAWMLRLAWCLFGAWIFLCITIIWVSNQKVDKHYCQSQNKPHHVFLYPILPQQLARPLIKSLWLLAYSSRFLRSLLQVFLPSFEKTHVLFHDIMDALEFSFHSVYILHWAWILKFTFFFLDFAIKLDEVKFWGKSFKLWFIVGGSEVSSHFIEKWCNDGIEEGSG